jgi:hypothetical protein
VNNKLFWEVEVEVVTVVWEEIERGGSNERGVGMEMRGGEGVQVGEMHAQEK